MNVSLLTLFFLTITLSTNAGFISIRDGISSMNGQSQLKNSQSAGITPLVSVLKSEFHKFKIKHNKVYPSAKEENMRFNNFISSFIEVESHNELARKGEKKFEMAINHFSDWSKEEFRNLNRLVSYNSTGSLYLSRTGKNDIPESIDWRKRGAVTKVKQQQGCASCWTFSATGALEGQIWRKTGKLISLSEQQIVDCDMDDFSCLGGFPSGAFEYIKKAGGIEAEEDYPYISLRFNETRRLCKFNKSKVVATDTGYVQLPQGDEEKLKEAVATIGPISIGISAPSTLSHYKRGIFHDDMCGSLGLSHAVLLVGYGTEESTGTPYWLLKNSYGSEWGENGYLRLRRNVNSCNVAMLATYPLV